MNILGIVGGPRKNGHTAQLVEAVLSGAREAGHVTKLFFLCDLEIKPLEADERGYVYPDDGMSQLYPVIESMGALVMGTPIYYDHVCSRIKLFIDRLHFYSKTHGEEYRERFPDGVKAVNIITYGWDKEDAYDEVLIWMDERMKEYWNMKIAGNIKAHGTGRDIQKHSKDLIEKATNIGRNL